jgi:hypothetical protein
MVVARRDESMLRCVASGISSTVAVDDVVGAEVVSCASSSISAEKGVSV